MSNYETRVVQYNNNKDFVENLHLIMETLIELNTNNEVINEDKFIIMSKAIKEMYNATQVIRVNPLYREMRRRAKRSPPVMKDCTLHKLEHPELYQKCERCNKLLTKKNLKNGWNEHWARPICYRYKIGTYAVHYTKKLNPKTISIMEILEMKLRFKHKVFNQKIDDSLGDIFNMRWELVEQKDGSFKRQYEETLHQAIFREYEMRL
jgi:hypothetical protein